MIMKKSLVIFTILSFTVLLAVNNSSAQSADSVIKKYIAKQAKEENAVEYKKARKIIYGDVNGDKKKDAIVQFTLEGFDGGNNWGQRLAVFLNTGKSYKFIGEEIVGGKFFTYTSDLKSVTNNKINLTTETCSEPPQGLCENPKKGKAVFVVKNGKLRQS